jgi:uncharacterized damage-inducible protein DinB
MATTLEELFKHNQWANLRLLDACAGLTEAQLAGSAPGTYGAIHETLVHISAAEERYVALLTGVQPEDSLRESAGFPGIPELRARVRRSGEQLLAAAARTPPEQILRGTRRGEPFAIRAVVPLVQVINHATEHRSQVMTALSQQGIEPPVLDGWTYGKDVLGE